MRALGAAHFALAGADRKRQFVASRMLGCGEWLRFAYYPDPDEVRLLRARFCMKHLLCPLCAIRRGAKALQAYLHRFEVVTAARPALIPYMVTLTVKDGADLRERFEHLRRSQRALWQRVHAGWRAQTSFAGLAAAVWSYEVKRGSGSGLWHPHLHMFALAEPGRAPTAEQLGAEWHDITGDSWVVDVHQVYGEASEAFAEVFKYALKFGDMDPADVWHAFDVLGGRRLVGSSGAFRGIPEPVSLLDEPLEGLPYVELLFRFFGGAYLGVPLPATRFARSQGVTSCTNN